MTHNDSGSAGLDEAGADASGSSSGDAASGNSDDASAGPGSPDASGADASAEADAALDSSAPDASVDASALDEASTPDAAELDSALPEADANVVDAAPDTSVAPDSGTSSCSTANAPTIGTIGLRAVIASSSIAGLTDAVQPPGSNDWYLVEQRGRVLVLREGATAVEATPFLDLTAEINLPNAAFYDDRGLVSIAFAPDYASSGKVYVSVTPDQGANANVDFLLEYTRSSEEPLRVDPNTRRVIVEARGRRLTSNGVTTNIHNGGRVAFGPDGMLYWANGDGGGVNCGDVEPGATQDVGTLFGKILRLDLTQPEPYGAADNPFVDGGDSRVFHYGLRNPFRFAFDRTTGDFYIGDVGQNRYEEVDFAPRGVGGLNFGWAVYEGNSRDTCPENELRAGSTHTPPIFVADRRAGATSPYSDYNAMIGGVVYRGSALPALQGVYLFGGYRGRRLGALYQCGSATSNTTAVLKNCDVNEPNAPCLRRVDGGPAFNELRAFVEDNAGEVYVVANGNSLLKLVPNQ